jgi:hypothetical protein
MKYFIDTEFLEGTQTKRILGIPYGETKPTIDLISIGIVAEDGREYYAISKDFNLEEAWNRYDLKDTGIPSKADTAWSKSSKYKVYWIRENVLLPIWKILMLRDGQSLVDIFDEDTDMFGNRYMSFESLKYLINRYGKTNKQIAKEVEEFCRKHLLCDKLKDKNGNTINQIEADATPKQFYAYYADYDWVAFCWLFGKMMNLPKGFPMYCIDLKQELDNIKLPNVKYIGEKDENGKSVNIIDFSNIKNHPNYPKQTNEHDALADAKWNKELYDFLNKL